MTVKRPEISKAQLLEEHPGNEEPLDGVFESVDRLTNKIPALEAVHQIKDFLAKTVELLICDDAGEVLGDGANVLGYRPGVVV